MTFENSFYDYWKMGKLNAKCEKSSKIVLFGIRVRKLEISRLVRGPSSGKRSL